MVWPRRRERMTIEQKIENLKKAIELFGEADKLIQDTLSSHESHDTFQEIEDLILILETKIEKMK
jgi:hypothetical protein